MKDWNKEHWITQSKDDIDLEPKGCAFCGCKILVESRAGWICDDCGMEINAVSYYQGVNAGRKKEKQKFV